MPGIAGIFGFGKLGITADCAVETWKAVSALNSISYQYRHFSDEKLVCLNTLTGFIPNTLSQPARDTVNDVVVFLEGEIFNWKELDSRFFSGLNNSNPVDFLASFYVKCGDSFTEYLNGEYNIVVFQPKREVVLIFSDHLASMPLYYTAIDGVFYFGSEKKYILPFLRKEPEIDSLGLLQIFAHKYNLDEKTNLKNIHRVKPGILLNFQDGQLKQQKHYSLSFQVPNYTGSLNELVDEWGEALRRATECRLAGEKKIIMSLSAGLDSRAIACSFPASIASAIISRTRGVESSLESLYASKIASALGFEHYSDFPESEPYSNLLPQIIWRTEGETHFLNCLSISSHSKFRHLGNFIAGGWLGDVSSGGHISADMLLPWSREVFINRAFKRHQTFTKAQLLRVFSESFLTENYPKLFCAFRDSFSELDGSPLQAYELWDLSQRQRRQTTSSMPIDSHCFEKLRPFYDKNYIEFTLRLPTRLRFGQCLYQSMIYRTGPKIRAIPSSNNNIPLRSSYSGNMLVKFQTLLERASARLRRKYNANYKSSVEKLALEDHGMMMRADNAFRRVIEDFLVSDHFDDSIFNAAAIKQLLNEHYAAHSDHSYLLGYLAGTAVAFDYLLGSYKACPESANLR